MTRPEADPDAGDARALEVVERLPLVGALDAMGSAVVVVENGVGMPIVYVNRAFELITGYARSDVLGRNCRFLRGAADDDVARGRFRAALAAGKPEVIVVRNQRADGEEYWNEVSLSPVWADGEISHFVGVQSDVTARVEATLEVGRLAHRDALTGLANRRRLDRHLARVVPGANDHGASSSLLYLDVDGFKKINDELGHAAGDELLRQLARRLEAVVRPSDLVARVGGDEFVVVLEADADVDAAAGAAKRVLEVTALPYEINGRSLTAGVSIGIAADGRLNGRDLLQAADAAMYRTKRRRSAPASAVAHAVPVAVEAPAAEPGALRAVLDAGELRSAYQPLVDLATGDVVGYEALTRGPAGSPLESPCALFAAAHAAGLLQELDWACRAAALRGARDALPTGATLFVNIEPTALIAPEPPALTALADEVAAHVPVVFELTDQALHQAPGATLSAVAALRERGFSIAFEDVGADEISVAFMPFVVPEVIKLDLQLVAGATPGQQPAAVVHTVGCVAQRTGAIVIAEGIETQEHRQVAQSLGARFGQGGLFGRPTRLGAKTAGGRPAPLLAPGRRARADIATDHRTPFELVTEVVPTQIATKRLLCSLAQYLEHHLAAPSYGAVLLATFQHARYFTSATRERYRRLGDAAAFVGVLAPEMPVRPLPGVRGADLDPAERLTGEWTVAVVTPHFAGAFVAEDLGDDPDDELDRRFTFSLTYDRDVAVRAARVLLQRIGDPPPTP